MNTFTFLCVYPPETPKNFCEFKAGSHEYALTEKVDCKPASAVDRSQSPTAMTSCANNLLNGASRGAVMTAEEVLSSKS